MAWYNDAWSGLKNAGKTVGGFLSDGLTGLISGASGGAAIGTAVSPGVGTLVGGAIGALSGLGISAYSAYKAGKASDANMQLQQKAYQTNVDTLNYHKSLDAQNFDYTVAQNELNRAREDTAYQRAVADAKAAGLSPLNVANSGGAGAGVVSAPPQSQVTGQLQPGQIADTSAALWSNLGSNLLKYSVERAKLGSQEKMNELDNDVKKQIASMQIAATYKNVVEQIDAAAALADKNNSASLERLREQLINQKSIADQQAEVQTADQQLRLYEYHSNNFEKMYGTTNFRFSNDLEKVRDFNSAREDRFNSFLDMYGRYLNKFSESASTGGSTSVNVGANDYMVRSGSAGISTSEQDSKGYSQDYTALYYEQKRRFDNENPVYIYDPDGTFERYYKKRGRTK